MKSQIESASYSKVMGKKPGKGLVEQLIKRKLDTHVDTPRASSNPRFKESLNPLKKGKGSYGFK